MLDNCKNILVRADANRQMGIGHAMRCLAVSEQLIALGHQVFFAMHQVPDALLARFAKAKVEVIHLNATEATAKGLTETAAKISSRHVLIDGYHIGNEFEQAFDGDNVRLVRFDDYMPGPRCNAHVVVNASPHAEDHHYRGWAPNADLLLGPQYIAFRSEMIDGHEALRARKAAASYAEGLNGNASILINFGGSDHLDMTVRTASAIAELLPDAKIEAVTGAAYPNPDRLKDLGIPNLIHHHNTDNLPEIMQRARMAISAGGLTVTELALFHIPTILAITAQNQIKGAHVSWCHTILPESSNGDINTGTMLKNILAETDRLWRLPEERKKITQRIPKELDIYGARRIANALLGETT